MLVYLIGMLMVNGELIEFFFYHAYIRVKILIICCSTRLVDKINSSVGQDISSQKQIGVLDIYGFECFKDNR